MPRDISIDISEGKKAEDIFLALSSNIRRKILELLKKNSYTIVEIAQIIKVPVSTTAFHINVLKKAELVNVTLRANSRGNAKVVSRQIDSLNVNFELEDDEITRPKIFTMDIPVGSFNRAEVQPGCGLAGENEIIISDDLPGAFYSPDRFYAQIVWFSKGFIEYNIPNYFCLDRKVKSVSFSMEICSEAPNYRNDWLSDITFWINDVELCTYVSPGDFGGRRGRLNPAWWSDFSTQYGIIKTVKVTESSTFLDEDSVSGVNINKLGINKGHYFTFKIGIKESSKHQGGLNIFGGKFGDYSQGLLMRIDYFE